MLSFFSGPPQKTLTSLPTLEMTYENDDDNLFEEDCDELCECAECYDIAEESWLDQQEAMATGN